MNSVFVIGIDCATVDSKIGLAAGEYSPTGLIVQKVRLCEREEKAADIVEEWLRNATVPTLLAIDSPLGWPVSMGHALASHVAGGYIDVKPNDLFRRETDRFIQSNLGKTPLDVGADRIARTAHAALALLAALRTRLNWPIPLSWDHNTLIGTEAIEVYPAATLASHGFRSNGYKNRNITWPREELVASLRTIISIPNEEPLLLRSPDALDAVVCLLAARDFLDGNSIAPADPMTAHREGWIWVRPRHLFDPRQQ